MMFCTSLFTSMIVKAFSRVPINAQPTTTLNTPPRPPMEADAAQHDHKDHAENLGADDHDIGLQLPV